MLPGPHKAVHDLEDFSLDYSFNGLLRRRHLWHEVIQHRKGWATVLACYEDFDHHSWSEPQFRLVRLRRLAGCWRTMPQHFNVKIAHLPGMSRALARAVGMTR